jgi:hypothetical protein
MEGSRRIPQEHVDLLKKSGILNPDITMEQIMNAAAELDGMFTEAEASVPTLVGPFYVYHSIEGGRFEQ